MGQKLGKIGVRATIIEGKSEGKHPCILKISPEPTYLSHADDLWGNGNYDTVRKLQLQFGKRVTIMSNGPSGEMQMKAATVASTDVEGRTCRHAARGGLGAVMGSKGLKAIVIDDGHLPKLAPKDTEAFRSATKSLVNAIRGHQGVAIYRLKYVDPGCTKLHQYIRRPSHPQLQGGFLCGSGKDFRRSFKRA